MEAKVEPLTDIAIVQRLARGTQGLDAGNAVLSPATWRKWLDAGESQCYVYQILVELRDIPYWVHVHLVRHHVGVLAYVRSQRPDSRRPVDYDRRKAPQDAPVNIALVANPIALINIARKRLCANASPETREVVRQIREALIYHGDAYLLEVGKLMVPDCEYRGGVCHSARPCGKCERAK